MSQQLALAGVGDAPMQECLSPAPPPRAPDPEWFGRTGHCGACGNPGNYCTCTKRKPCHCGGHDVGSARPKTAGLSHFRPACTDQADLFGDAS